MERPILFSAPMVSALLAGRKTQTRRVIKPQPTDYPASERSPAPQARDGWPQKHPAPYFDSYNRTDRWCWWDEYDRQGPDWIRCPYGVVGDRLYVRETWKPHSLYAGMTPREVPITPIFYKADDTYAPSNTPWKPGIHMPRWASRIDLVVEAVRVQRLNDISEDDALAEGAQEPALVPIVGVGWSSRCMFAKLWEHINGKGSWDANPWVWAVTFAVEVKP